MMLDRSNNSEDIYQRLVSCSRLLSMGEKTKENLIHGAHLLLPHLEVKKSKLIIHIPKLNNEMKIAVPHCCPLKQKPL